MNRREFLGMPLAASVSALLSRGGGGRTDTPAPSSAPKELAGMTLQQLREQYRYHLFGEFLPFMDRYVIDHQYGGFMCNVDWDGARLSDRKETWFQGRGIWVYSFLYANFSRNEKYRETARKAVDFVLKVRPARPGVLWAETSTREGKPLGPPATSIYGDVFIAEGLAEYARAAGEDQYWDLAKQIILQCWRVYNRADYEPDIVASYHGPAPLRFPGARIQGVSMVMIRAVGLLLASRPDAQLEKIISECCDAVIEKHYNPEFQLNNELLDHDYSLPKNELAQFVYTGHSIETLWMIMWEAARRKDEVLFRTAAERFERHVEVAWDDVYGGVFRSLNDVDRNLWATDKALWAQEEVLNGTLMLIERSGDRWAQRMYNKMYSYVVAKFPLRRYGYALWMPYADRRVTFQPHGTRAENYHHPRHLMLALLALERMIQQKNPAAQSTGNGIEDGET